MNKFNLNRYYAYIYMCVLYIITIYWVLSRQSLYGGHRDRKSPKCLPGFFFPLFSKCMATVAKYRSLIACLIHLWILFIHTCREPSVTDNDKNRHHRQTAITRLPTINTADCNQTRHEY